MKTKVIFYSALTLFLSGMILMQTVNAVPTKGTLRVSGDNSWVVFINGEKVAAHGNWTQPTVSEFELDKGFAQIAVYVHDPEPGAQGRGGFLADIILNDKPYYIGTGEEGWRCNTGKPIGDRDDGWEEIDFDDSKWEDLQIYEQFGGGIWGFGAAQMRAILNDPDCEAHWMWCGPNDVKDDAYFRYTIGSLSVEPEDTLATAWGTLKPDTEYTLSKPKIAYIFSENTIHVGDTFTLNLTAEDVSDLAGWQFDITFDPTLLETLEIKEGAFLKTGGGATFFQKGTIDNATGKITKLSSVMLSKDGVSGTGSLLSVIFRAKISGETRLALRQVQFGSITGNTISAGPHEVIITITEELATGDINRDGQVNVLDLIQVAQYLGEDASANPEADVNADGVISILDLIVVASHLGESTAGAAPLVLATDGIKELDPAMIQTWIEQAQLEDDGSIAFKHGIVYLQHLLALLVPKETALLANYPNPFNPETWIPFHLAKTSFVVIHIYDVRGAVVRQLDLGHKITGYYTTQSRAAYWDGRNTHGESVASGVYFYTLTAGDFNATRKMLIKK